MYQTAICEQILFSIIPLHSLPYLQTLIKSPTFAQPINHDIISSHTWKNRRCLHQFFPSLLSANIIAFLKKPINHYIITRHIWHHRSKKHFIKHLLCAHHIPAFRHPTN
uniref:Uncharacterized protein n=1 Tax=Rhizophora mucronata TaxID=61149 RepID=A0A2P2QEI8_RHIMU